MAEPAGADPRRIWTVPNGLSFLRLLGVPLFLWLLLGPEADGWALTVLAVSAITDWLDGVVARLLDQRSALGALLDPLADRLYILATVVALTVRGIVPLVLVLVIIGRDVVMTVTLAVLRRHGFAPLRVHFLGKAATFALLYALPLLLLGAGSTPVAEVAKVLGWAFAGWGTGLYLLSAWLYVVQAATLVRPHDRTGPAAPRPAAGAAGG